MKTKKVTVSVFQILIFFVVVAIIIISAILIVSNINKGEKTTNQIEEGERSEFFSGLGTENSPYLIQSKEDLTNLSTTVNIGKDYNGKYFYMVNDINLSGDEQFLPIGSQNTFNGIFDGNNKTISNFSATVSKDNIKNKIGIFGNNGGTVKNLRVIGNIFIDDNINEAELRVAIICADNTGKIEGCRAEGTITAINMNTLNNSYISGISAENSGEIINSSSLVNINSNLKKAGVCVMNYGDITNCTNAGIIKEETASTNYTIGVVYRNNGIITNCTNSGNIQGYIVSGIAGISSGDIISCQNKGEISNIYPETDMTEKSISVGIVVELENDSTLENSRNSGIITAIEQGAGIVAINKGSILNCTNEARIEKKENSTLKDIDISGICAINKEGTIEGCKNIAEVIAKNNLNQTVKIGTICASIYNTAIVQNCENSGKIKTEGKDINISKDDIENIVNCINYGTGEVEPTEQGKIYVGMIYGKLEEE